jgi:hypothetical protein
VRASTSVVASSTSDVDPHAIVLRQAGLVMEPEKVSQALGRLREVLMEALEDSHQKVTAIVH